MLFCVAPVSRVTVSVRSSVYLGVCDCLSCPLLFTLNISFDRCCAFFDVQVAPLRHSHCVPCRLSACFHLAYLLEQILKKSLLSLDWMRFESWEAAQQISDCRVIERRIVEQVVVTEASWQTRRRHHSKQANETAGTECESSGGKLLD